MLTVCESRIDSVDRSAAVEGIWKVNHVEDTLVLSNGQFEYTHKKESGYYTLIQFSMDSPEPLTEMDRILRLNENVLRHMVIKISAPSAPKAAKEAPAAAAEEQDKAAEEATPQGPSALPLPLNLQK